MKSQSFFQAKTQGKSCSIEYSPWGIAVKVPLGRRCREDVFHVHIEGGEDLREFVDQRNVDVALDVFNDFGRLGNLESANVANVFRGQASIQRDQCGADVGVRTANHASHPTNAVGGISGIETLGTVCDFQVFANLQSEFFDYGRPRLCGDAWRQLYKNSRSSGKTDSQ